MPPTAFDATMYVSTYALARDGRTNDEIALALGTSVPTFHRWLKRHPALRDALDRGRVIHQDMAGTFHDYIYDHLSPELQDLWQQIHACATLDNGIERVRALMANHGKAARQHLFLYALCQSNFNATKALRTMGLSRRVFQDWLCNDPDFAALVDEIHWHKQNFYVNAFDNRVRAGDTACILHAVKTQCRERGFNDKVTVEHTGNIGSGNTVSIAELDLDLETRQKVLEAVRAHQRKAEAAATNAALGLQV